MMGAKITTNLIELGSILQNRYLNSINLMKNIDNASSAGFYHPRGREEETWM